MADTPHPWVSTQNDLADMNWHDVQIHAVAMDPDTYDLLFDIDYILEWDLPHPPDNHIAFWIAPATLVFHNVLDLEVRIKALHTEGLQIIEIAQGDEELGSLSARRWWTIETDCGYLQFTADGYTQYLRRQPVRVRPHLLSWSQRGGISFARERDRE